MGQRLGKEKPSWLWFGLLFSIAICWIPKALVACNAREKQI